MTNEEMNMELERYLQRISELDIKNRTYENVIKMILDKIEIIKMK